MEESIKTAAVVLAAGYSSRMGSLKPLLPMGDRTVIETVIGTFQQAGIYDIYIVVGHEHEKILPVLEGQNIAVVYNREYKKGMFTSVQAGIRCLQSHETEAFFLLPADYALIQVETLRKLAAAYRENDAMVVYPCHRGQRGHPPLLSTVLISEIMDYHGQGGLRKLLDRHESEALDLAVEDEGILLDMDTREDYRYCLEKFRIRT